ncbi:MAG: helix-turn-helix domain-containing protein [Actinomycetota bacterium]|nr:helix-turn-helix domain-containing protein [Actinomycetota bacterium]
MADTHNPTAVQDRLLSPAELADYLGIPVQTVYQWRHRGEGPPGYRVGRHVRYRWIDIQGWLDDQADDIPRLDGTDDAA